MRGPKNKRQEGQPRKKQTSAMPAIENGAGAAQPLRRPERAACFARLDMHAGFCQICISKQTTRCAFSRCAQGLRGDAAKVRRAAANERAKERKKSEASGKVCSQHPTLFRLKVRLCA